MMQTTTTKLNTIHALLLFFGISLTHIVFGQTMMSNTETVSKLRIMTYNLKFASPDFKPSWDVRREYQVQLIHEYDPDIIGTQEGLKEQIDWLADHLPEYEIVGEGRKGGDDDEHMAIFYKRDKFRLREMHSFQLSETPDIIGSGPEVNPRMVTWVRLAMRNRQSITGNQAHPQDFRGHWENTQEFYFFNTHLFNGPAKLARLSAAKLIQNRIQALGRFGEWSPERPLFLVGDFNCRPGSEPYKVLVGDPGSNNPEMLKNAYEDPGKIDWILYKGTIKVLKYEEIDFNVNGVYPSDHKPLVVDFGIFER